MGLESERPNKLPLGSFILDFTLPRTLVEPCGKSIDAPRYWSEISGVGTLCDPSDIPRIFIVHLIWLISSESSLSLQPLYLGVGGHYSHCRTCCNVGVSSNWGTILPKLVTNSLIKLLSRLDMCLVYNLCICQSTVGRPIITSPLDFRGLAVIAGPTPIASPEHAQELGCHQGTSIRLLHRLSTKHLTCRGSAHRIIQHPNVVSIRSNPYK